MKVALLSIPFCAALAAQVTKPAPAAAPKPAQTAPKATVPASKPAQTDPNTIVLRAGDFTLTAAQFNELASDTSIQQAIAAIGRRAFAEKIVELHFLSQEALTRGLDKDPNLKMQLDFQTNKLLAQAMFENLQKTIPVPDADVQTYYDAHKSDYDVIVVRHILIRVKGSPLAARPGTPELSEDEAKARAEAIRKRLVAGEDFAKLARLDSDDTTSGAKGGDLGNVAKGKMVAPFEQAAFALKPGDISQPVRSMYGYHIIQVQSHRTKTLAEVKDAIVAQIRPSIARNASKVLVDSQKAVLDRQFFPPPAAR